MTISMGHYIGSDVSKGRLDVVVLGVKTIIKMANTEKGIAGLLIANLVRDAIIRIRKIRYPE